MNLTGKQLVDLAIITGAVFSENIQQHGVDLNVIAISEIAGYRDEGVVYADASKGLKTKLAARIECVKNEDEYGIFWYLEPGAYEVTFSQGCTVPADKMLLIRQRSSLLRNGTILHSSVFDAGFKTDKIGTVMLVATPIKIYVGARIAQIYAHNSNTVENLYDGQWQGDVQRKEN